MTAYTLKRHATDDIDPPDRTLCGEPMDHQIRTGNRTAIRVDNSDPNCKRCLRAIAARYKRA